MSQPYRRVAIIGATLLATLVATLCVPAASSQAHAKPLRIGVVFDGPPRDADKVLTRLAGAITEVSMGDFEATVTHSLTGDWTAATAMNLLAELQGKRDVDVIIAAGIMVSNAVYGMDKTKKPIIAPIGVNLGGDGPSGIKNVGFGWIWDIDADVAAFGRLVTFKKLAAVMHPEMAKIPGLMEAIAARMPKGTVIVEWDVDGATTVAAIPDDVDAVYLGIEASHRAGTTGVAEFAAALKKRKLPSFSMRGEADVEQGLFAGIGEPAEPARLIRWISVQGSLVGMRTSLTSRQSVRASETRLYLNLETAETIDIEVPWSVASNAKTYGEVSGQEHEGREAGALTLGAAAREAIANNLQAKAAVQNVTTFQETVGRERAPLLPQLDGFVNGSIIDADRARTAFGGQPQGEMKVGATLRQILYDEQSHTKLSVSRYILSAAEAQQATVLLDVVAEAGSAYLAIQLARANLQIQQEQLRQSQINLNLSQTKSTIGSGARGDVLRWQSQVAADQSALVGEATKLTLVELDLARVLNRRMRGAVPTQPSSFDDERFSGPQALRDALESPVASARLENYLVHVGKAASPELREIQASVDLNTRVAEGASRSFWAPQIAIDAGIDYRLVRAGAGSDFINIPIPGVGSPQDDLNFFATVQLNLPLFTGMARTSARDEARSETIRFQSVAEYQGDLIEQRVRSAVRLASGAYAQVTFLKEAAVSAKANLELVNDGYRRGAFDITRVIDALNASRVSDQTAVAAEFEYQNAVVALYRSIGGYYFLMTDDEKADFVERIRLAVESVSGSSDAADPSGQ